MISWCNGAAIKWPELALIYAVPNAAVRSFKLANFLKGQGMKAGVPDLVLPVARQGLHGLYIEMKPTHEKIKQSGKTPDSVWGTEQRWWHAQLRRVGYGAYVCYGAKDAIRIIERYLGHGAAAD